MIFTLSREISASRQSADEYCVFNGTTENDAEISENLIIFKKSSLHSFLRCHVRGIFLNRTITFLSLPLIKPFTV